MAVADTTNVAKFFFCNRRFINQDASVKRKGVGLYLHGAVIVYSMPNRVGQKPCPDE